jgi:hypothetical protein
LLASASGRFNVHIPEKTETAPYEGFVRSCSGD